MLVTKVQLANGISNYIRNEMAPQIPNTPLKIAAGTLARAIKANPCIVDRLIFSNNMLGSVIGPIITTDANDTYDTDILLTSLSESIKEYGCLPLTIGKQTLSFTATDVDQLKSYIEGGNT